MLCLAPEVNEVEAEKVIADVPVEEKEECKAQEEEEEEEEVVEAKAVGVEEEPPPLPVPLRPAAKRKAEVLSKESGKIGVTITTSSPPSHTLPKQPRLSPKVVAPKVVLPSKVISPKVAAPSPQPVSNILYFETLGAFFHRYIYCLL